MCLPIYRGQVLASSARVVRLVSLSPTLTESVCVLGACDRLVGVDRFSNWPESVTKLPHLGSLGSFNVEAVAALRPDLVLMAGDGPLVKQLERLGVPVFVLSPQRHADVADTLARLARVLGLPPARAQQVWDDIRRELHDLAESLPISSKITLPLLASSRRFIERRRVDFPLPDGPIIRPGSSWRCFR